MALLQNRILPALMGLTLIIPLCVLPSAASSQWDHFNQLATSAYKDGALADAEDYFKSALQEADKNPNEGHLAAALTNLGAVYRDEGKFDLSEDCFKRSLQIKEASLGRLDPSVASTLQHYAALLKQMHRMPEARQLEARADGIMIINKKGRNGANPTALAAAPQQTNPADEHSLDNAMLSGNPTQEPTEEQLKQARSLYDQAERERRDGRLFDAHTTEARAHKLFGNAFADVWRTTANQSALDEQAAEDARIAAENAQRARAQEQQMRDEEQVAMENQPLVPVSYTDYGGGGLPSTSNNSSHQWTGAHGTSYGHVRPLASGALAGQTYSNNPAGMAAVPSIGPFTPSATGTPHPIMCGRATSFCRH